MDQESGISAAQAVLDLVFGPVDAGGYLAVVEIPASSWGQTADWSGAYLPFAPGKLPDLAAFAARSVVEASNWYFSPVVYGSRRRTKADVVGGATLWADFDSGGADPAALPLRPSIVIESSPGRYHCFWLLTTPLSLGTLEYYNRKLAAAFGADMGGWDANQLLRLPLGINSKRDTLTTVRLISFDSTLRYTLEDLEGLPGAAPRPSADAPVPDWHASAPDGCDTLPAYQAFLLGKHSAALPAEVLRLLGTRDPDRSRALWHIFNACARAGLPPQEAFFLVLGTPNDKYTTLRTGKQEALWHDLLGGYAQAARGAADRGIIDQILAIRKGKGTSAEKVGAIGRLLVAHMAQEGAFYQTPGAELYYLDGVGGGGHLMRCEPRDDALRKLVLDRYGLDPSGSEWSSLYEHLASRALDAVPVRIHRLSAYDPSRAALYINRYDTSCYLLEQHRLSVLPNGTDGVLFMDPGLTTPFTAALPPGSHPAGGFWERLILPCAHLAGSAEEVRIGRHILYAWTLALFFPELFAVKPILLLHGDPGSGKTMLFKALLKVLVGPEAKPDAPYADPDSFDAAATNHTMLFIDNADDYQRWLANKLALVATSYAITKRKLYTDNTVFTAVASCFVGVTSRSPRFLQDRQDVTERVLPLRVTPHREALMNEGALLDEINAARGALWAELFADLQHLLHRLAQGGGGLPPFRGDFRQADFAAFLGLTAPMRGLTQEDCLAYIKAAQGQEVLEEDPLLYALRQWIALPGHAGRSIAPAALDLELAAGAGGDEYRHRVASPRALATRLGRLMTSGYLTAAHISASRTSGDSPQYAFWLRDRDSGKSAV